MVNLASGVPCVCGKAFPLLMTPAAGSRTHRRVRTHAAASKNGLACRVARSGGGGARWLRVTCAAGGGAAWEEFAWLGPRGLGALLREVHAQQSSKEKQQHWEQLRWSLVNKGFQLQSCVSSRRKSGGTAPVSAASISVTNGDPTGKPAGCHWGESTCTGMCSHCIQGSSLVLLGAKKEVDLAALKGEVFSTQLTSEALIFALRAVLRKSITAICMGAGPDDEALCSFFRLVRPSSMKRNILATFKSTEDLILVGDAFVTEDTTNVKFPRELTVPGYTYPLVAVGTGYRDKFFVKVYAAAFYVDYSLRLDTEQWKEKIGIESLDGSSVFDSIFKAPVVKSLSIILVRAVDGKTFVNALNDVIARQIKNPNAEEESSLSTLQNTFLGRNLKQGTSIYLTWLEPKRMLISISENQDPRQVDAEIESATVNYALYDGFFGKSPVSPSLRSSTAQLLEALLQ